MSERDIPSALTAFIVKRNFDGSFSVEADLSADFIVERDPTPIDIRQGIRELSSNVESTDTALFLLKLLKNTDNTEKDES